MKAAAALLLVAGVLRHYGWELVRPEWQAQIWNISGAMVILPLLWFAAYRYRETVLIALWWSFEEVEVILCGGWRLLYPVDVAPGEAQCSALLGWNVSSLGLVLIAAILVAAYVRTDRTQNAGDGS